MSDDRDWWQLDGAHYRELAAWLREVACKCRLPNPQQELLTLAKRYERRAEYLDRRARYPLPPQQRPKYFVVGVSYTQL
jgi:hypothetical protein